jgi:hypothetical protein
VGGSGGDALTRSPWSRHGLKTLNYVPHRRRRRGRGHGAGASCGRNRHGGLGGAIPWWRLRADRPPIPGPERLHRCPNAYWPCQCDAVTVTSPHHFQASSSAYTPLLVTHLPACPPSRHIAPPCSPLLAGCSCRRHWQPPPAACRRRQLRRRRPAKPTSLGRIASVPEKQASNGIRRCGAELPSHCGSPGQQRSACMFSRAGPRARPATLGLRNEGQNEWMEGALHRSAHRQCSYRWFRRGRASGLRRRAWLRCGSRGSKNLKPTYYWMKSSEKDPKATCCDSAVGCQSFTHLHHDCNEFTESRTNN